jgi:hypothetical protein
MLVEGAIRRDYADLEIVNVSRSNYGFMLSEIFRAGEGDPVWSRGRDYWYDRDLCTVRVAWQVRKVSRSIP